MGDQVDYVIGKIKSLCEHGDAGWSAFWRADYKLSDAKDEIVRLRKIIRELKKGKKK